MDSGTINSLAAFTLGAALITVTPGLDTMLVVRTGAVEGSRRAMAAAVGIVVGCLTWGAIVALGLGALIAASRLFYDALRFAGAAYLVYLGVKMLWTRRAPIEAAIEPQRRSSWFVRGLVTNLLNPKIGAFYVAFLPPFIPADANVVAFTLLLAAIHALLGLLWFAVLIGGVRSVAPAMTSPSVATWLDRVAGTILIGLGIKLALSSRH